MLRDDVGGGGGMVQEGGDLCMPSADSHWCAAETNTTLQSNSPPVKTHTHTHTHTHTPLQQTHVIIQQKATQHCKAILLQLKHTHRHRGNCNLYLVGRCKLVPLCLSLSFFFFFLPPLNLPLLTWSLPLFAIKSSVSTSAIHFKFLPI